MDIKKAAKLYELIIKGIKLNIVWGVYLNKQGKLRVNWI